MRGLPQTHSRSKLALGAALLLLVSLPGEAHAYLDPASGSLFLQLLLGGVAGASLALKMFWGRIAGAFSRRKPGEEPTD